MKWKPEPERTVWYNMRARCSNPQIPTWKNYGARGILVCDRWRESFDNFIADMGYRPSALHSLDRIDNNGNYEPANCRWATRSQQNYNRRVYNRRDILGSTYGRLAVMKRIEGYPAKWICKCACGTVKTIHANQLISNKTVSCGCWNREIAASRCSEMTRIRWGHV